MPESVTKISRQEALLRPRARGTQPSTRPCGAPGWSTNGPTVAPDAAMPAITGSPMGIPPAPGKNASGEHAPKQRFIGGGNVHPVEMDDAAHLL